jgi:hypothetical protein
MQNIISTSNMIAVAAKGGGTGSVAWGIPIRTAMTGGGSTSGDSGSCQSFSIKKNEKMNSEGLFGLISQFICWWKEARMEDKVQ